MPYIKTAFFNEEDSDDIQTHVNPIRVRVTGSGNLMAVLNDTGTVNNEELHEQALSTSSARSINFLSNFTAEKICLTLMTNEINEFFSISNVWAYVKPSRLSFPQ